MRVHSLRGLGFGRGNAGSKTRDVSGLRLRPAEFCGGESCECREPRRTVTKNKPEAHSANKAPIFISVGGLGGAHFRTIGTHGPSSSSSNLRSLNLHEFHEGGMLLGRPTRLTASFQGAGSDLFSEMQDADKRALLHKPPRDQG